MHKSKGNILLVTLIAVLVIVLVLSVIPVIGSLDTATAVSKLESQDYVVMTAGDFLKPLLGNMVFLIQPLRRLRLS